MGKNQDRASRMVDFSMEEALISFDVPKEPTEEEIEEMAQRIENMEEV